MNKQIAILITYFIFSLSVSAQENPVYKKYWSTNYQLAIDSAKTSGKSVLILFSGSDWCKPCIKLRTQILETDTFIAYAQKNFVLFNADFPYHKKIDKITQQQNDNLAEQFNKQGSFPKVVIVSFDGKILFEKGFIDCTPQEYIKLLSTNISAK